VQVHKNRYEILDTDQIFGAAQQETALQEVSIEFRPYPTARISLYLDGAR
jgi:hypothetical protein